MSILQIRSKRDTHTYLFTTTTLQIQLCSILPLTKSKRFALSRRKNPTEGIAEVAVAIVAVRGEGTGNRATAGKASTKKPGTATVHEVGGI